MSREWWLLTLPLLAACCGCHSHGETGDHEAEDPESGASVTVQVVPARFDRSARIVEGLGRCEALPDHIATLTPAVEGHVHELLVKQGDPVKKGQPIVELDEAVARADLAEKTATRDGLKSRRWPCSSRSPAPRSGGPTSWPSSRPRSPSSRPGSPPTGSGRSSPGTRSPKQQF